MKKMLFTLLFAMVALTVASEAMACGCGGGARPRPNRTIASL
jgi:hypothetical protein